MDVQYKVRFFDEHNILLTEAELTADVTTKVAIPLDAMYLTLDTVEVADRYADEAIKVNSLNRRRYYRGRWWQVIVREDARFVWAHDITGQRPDALPRPWAFWRYIRKEPNV